MGLFEKKTRMYNCSPSFLFVQKVREARQMTSSERCNYFRDFDLAQIVIPFTISSRVFRWRERESSQIKALPSQVYIISAMYDIFLGKIIESSR